MMGLEASNGSLTSPNEECISKISEPFYTRSGARQTLTSLTPQPHSAPLSPSCRHASPTQDSTDVYAMTHTLPPAPFCTPVYRCCCPLPGVRSRFQEQRYQSHSRIDVRRPIGLDRRGATAGQQVPCIPASQQTSAAC